LVTTADKCWIPSLTEIGYPDGMFFLKGQGERYADTFAYDTDDKSVRIKYLPDMVTPGEWWLRTSYYSGDNPLVYGLQTSGLPYGEGMWNSFYIVFGFCV
jgi:hypothetical protein